MHEKDFDIAVSRAEGEGMTGRVQPIPRPRLSFDTLALLRAEGEGMVVRKQTLRAGVTVKLM